MTGPCACLSWEAKRECMLSRSLQRMPEGKTPCWGMRGATRHVVIFCVHSSTPISTKCTAWMRLAKTPRYLRRPLLKRPAWARMIS